MRLSETLRRAVAGLRRPGWLVAAGAVLTVVALGGWRERVHARELAALLETVRCEPLTVRDRAGARLHELPSGCPARGHYRSLAEIPGRLQELVLGVEDRRFVEHNGVDALAAGRALVSNLRAGRVVSGASTISMQLARLLRARPRSHSLSSKLQQAWDALTLERLLTKSQILEAYFNLAYYGASAFGVGDAAQVYFGQELMALDDAQLALLALLPRAPAVYDPLRHPEHALRRRKVLTRKWLAGGLLNAEQALNLERAGLGLGVSGRAGAAPARAQHFVDWVVGSLPGDQRQRGGQLYTTLDLSLQSQAERLVREHVDQLADRGVTEAAVVVLDTRSAEVRAMVGSYDYARSQLNATTRRRQLGSLLKPFVYGLAIEAGATPDSLADDVGDVPSAYRARDWVGHEAGPLRYREALAGSYNLAAVHVLERVGVGALHQLLRRAGVAQLDHAPERYGLALALGSARVRLIDVAAGYGFLARAGAVRRATGVVSLTRGDGSRFYPEPARDIAVLSARASAQVADILMDPAARHRRFGRGLPLEEPFAQRVALKTGTASGMSDLSAIVVSSEFIVAAWSGRFDGAPTQGLSGMWAALPLARRVLSAAMGGREPRLSVASTPPAATPARIDALPSALEPWAERARARLTHKSALVRDR